MRILKPNTKYIKKLIDLYKKEYGISQKEIANHIGYNDAHLSKVLSGHNTSDKMLICLVSYFNAKKKKSNGFTTSYYKTIELKDLINDK